MKVAIVSRIYRPEPSAASFFLGAVADELLARGDQVTVFTARPPRSAPPFRGGERVLTFPVLRDGNGYVRGYLPYASFDIPLFFRLLFARRPDVVLVEPPPTTGAVVRVVCGLRRIPYVYDAADIWSDAANMATSSRLVPKLLRRLERFAMGGAARLVTISRGVVERVRALGVSRPVEVTGFGADTSSFSYRSEPVEPLVVYAGSYSTWHGAEIVVDAVAQLRGEGRDVRLLVIGNGERDLLADRARVHGMAAVVRFAAPVHPAELSDILARATVSVATLRPGTGYDYAFTSKVYSSLAAGCPVVFAGPGPTGPFIEDARRVVRAGAAVAFDPRELTDALRAVLDDPLSDADRQAVAEWTAREHSMSAVARRVSDQIAAAHADRSSA
ncbi:glycosyltransferase family 4 protein [Microbacterium sp. CJ88]|uniref:glycosyltransferase family 4 protein n=1 Tax=Microbacterium sp. CJ88 TaxID=3445672 RepID=UPI003F6557A7